MNIFWPCDFIGAPSHDERLCLVIADIEPAIGFGQAHRAAPFPKAFSADRFASVLCFRKINELRALPLTACKTSGSRWRAKVFFASLDTDRGRPNRQMPDRRKPDESRLADGPVGLLEAGGYRHHSKLIVKVDTHASFAVEG